MNIQDFAGIAIIGVGASIIMSYIKAKFGTSSNVSKAIIVLISIVSGIIFYILTQNEALYQIVITILGIASTFYSFFLKNN
jgi:hypothetical protein